MKASELLRGCDVTLPAEDMDLTGVVSDSRRVRGGELFICHTGTRHDGHYHAAEAVRRGAAAVLAERKLPLPEGVCQLITADTRRAEAMIWYQYTGRPTDGMKTVAVTGTAGKTSVAFLLEHIFKSAGRDVGLISTVRVSAKGRILSLGENGGSSVSDLAGAMTTPDPEYFFQAAAEMRAAGCDTLVFEASSQALAMGRLSPLRVDAAVFTNLSPEHLDTHGSMENYFRAKASLLSMTRFAVINADDEWMARLYGMEDGVKMLRCSASPARVTDCEVCALRYASRGAEGMEYVYFSEHAVFRIVSPLVGHYSVYNTMEAAACAIAMGVDPLTVKEAIRDFTGAEGRLYRVPLPGTEGMPAVFLDYAHTPAAIRAVLSALREIAPGRLTAVFGCGGQRDRSKRPMMAEAAEEWADNIIVTGDNPRGEDPGQIVEDILAGFTGRVPYRVIPDRREAIRTAVTEAEPGEWIVLLGKGHEKYEITKDGRHPFDEEALVKEAAAHRRDNSTGTFNENIQISGQIPGNRTDAGMA